MRCQIPLFLCLFVFSNTLIAQPTLNPHITQLHIHGWSNHNGAIKPGSIGFHNWQADSANVDVLWWSEHHNIYKQDTFNLFFNGSYVDSTTYDILGIPFTSNGSYNGWKCVKREGLHSAEVLVDELKLSIASSNIQWESLSYAPQSGLGTIRNIKFVKPLASKPVLRFRVDPDFSNNYDCRVRLVFKLAYQHRTELTQDVIVYDLVPQTLPSFMISNQRDTVFVQMPIGNGIQQMNLDIANVALLLDKGIDNTLSEMELMVQSRNGALTAASFGYFQLIPTELNVDSMLAAENSILDFYTALGQTHNILGVEYSNTPHMNGFLPKGVRDLDVFTGFYQQPVSSWVNKVHSLGGLVSYNHMFGTDWSLASDQLQEYRADTLADFLLSNRAYSADILEVGFVQRGGTDLRRHLRVWDKLTAKGVFMYGNGVSDSHGDLWMNFDNIFHTWIYSRDTSDSSLLAALSKGKMTFGNHKYFNGNFWYSVGNLEMGDRGLLDSANNTIDIHLSGAPADAVVKLTQALIDENNDINYIYDQYPIDLNNPPALDFSKPCFFRLGVYDANDKPLIFGQPIVVLGVVSDTLVPAPSTSLDINLYPNPAEGYTNIDLHVVESGNYRVALSNSLGQELLLVDDRFFYDGRYGIRLPTTKLPIGILYVTVVGQNTKVAEKLISR